MNYLNFHLILSLWAITSISCGSSAEPVCRQVEDQSEFSRGCFDIQLDEYRQSTLFGVDTTKIDVLSFGRVKGKVDASITTNFTSLRSILVLGSSLDRFEVNSRSLENLQLVDSSFPAGTKFAECCANLEKLTLRNNTGLNIQSEAFSDLRKLKKLYLSHQPLQRITRSTFKGLRSLKKLSLRDTSTTSIEADAFMELTKLKEFYLEDDTLASIDSSVFRPLRRLTSLTIYGENLKPLSLEMFSEQRSLVQIGLPLATWRVVDIEKIPSMFPKLYAHSYIGEWKSEEEREYFFKTFFRLSQLLLDRQ